MHASCSELPFSCVFVLKDPITTCFILILSLSPDNVVLQPERLAFPRLHHYCHMPRWASSGTASLLVPLQPCWARSPCFMHSMHSYKLEYCAGGKCRILLPIRTLGLQPQPEAAVVCQHEGYEMVSDWMKLESGWQSLSWIHCGCMRLLPAFACNDTVLRPIALMMRQPGGQAAPYTGTSWSWIMMINSSFQCFLVNWHHDDH
jgi:hypothetical protein